MITQDLGIATAYGYAKSKGYTGTEVEFAELMASYAEVGQTAVDAAETATTKASEASASASTAQTAANTATTKAGEASQSASTAQTASQTATTKASEASTSAQTATAKASEATTKASEASQSASDALVAKTAAETAQGNAESAKTDAESAKTDAEQAKADTQDIVAGINAKSEQIDQNVEDISDLQTAISTKAEVDGNYENLTAGTAEQLIGEVISEDNVPYIIRKSIAGNSDRLYDQIVGGTVNYTQRIVNRADMFAGYNAQFVFNDGTITVTPSDTPSRVYQSIKTIKGHKYLVLATFKGTIGEALISWYGALVKTTSMSGSWQTLANLLDNTYDSNDAWQVYFGCTNNTELAEYQVKDMQCFDLTQMFGVTIADYIYQLEQTTAGAGVVLFKSLFPNDYYPYNAGGLVSVSGLSEHKMTGFNQWDEEWEVGAYALSDGQKSVDNSRMRNKNFIHVFPSTSYCNGCPQIITALFYDSDKNFIGQYGYNSGQVFVTPARAQYMNFYVAQSYGNVYKNDICINLSDPAKNGTYKPYKAHSYPLDSNVELRGLFKLDANNDLYADGDIYDAAGTVTRKYGIVDLGSLTWTHDTSLKRFYAGISTSVKPASSAVINAISSIYYAVSMDTFGGSTSLDHVMAMSSGGNLSVRNLDLDSGTASAFKTAMSGVMLVYELATPTTENADPYQHLQQCDPNGTEEYVTTSIVPVGHVTKYANNLRAKLEMAPNSPDGDGDYIVRQTSGLNEYVSLSSSEVIQNINEAISDNAEQIETKADITELLKAFPTDTATGAVASFSDGANLPVKSLIVNIDPVQGGIGDPSPTNVRPISGWSEVNVEKCGKNLFDAEGIVESSGHPDQCYIYDGYLLYYTGSSTVNGINWLGLKIPCPCVFHGTIKNFSTAGINTIRFKFSLDDGTYESPTLVSELAAEASSDFSVTIGTPGKTLVAIQNTWNDSRPAGLLLSNTQLELGSTATPYEPYQSTSLTISLGQTVYGGKLDVVSGVLTVDRKYKNVALSNFAYNEQINCLLEYSAYNTFADAKSPANNNTKFNAVADAIAINSAGAINGGSNGFGITTTKDVYLRSSGLTSKAEYLSAFPNGINVAYELATPLTVTLTPHEVTALLGSNNVWADTGDSAVEYRADPTLYIQRKIAEALS